MIESIEQRLVELIGEMLDDDSTKLDEMIAIIEDPIDREESELHIRMAKAAMAEYVKTMVDRNTRESISEPSAEKEYQP